VNALHLAEQATLGALMVDPHLPVQVTGWLRAEDFAHPWHASVYATIRELHTAHEPVEPGRVGRELAHRLGYRTADLPQLVDLLQAAPSRPAGRRYAAMVLEAALRRQTACQAVLLQAAALSAALAGHSRPVVRTARQIDDTLTAAETRWAVASRVSAVPAREPLTARLTSLGDGVAADRIMQAHPPLDLAAVATDEAALVASLASHHAAIPRTVTWLKPDALINPEWRAVYSAVLQLHELGEPIDAVTLAWEVRRTSSRLGPGPATRDLRDGIEVAASRDPIHAGRVVASDHLRLTADRAADALRQCAANPGIDLSDVLATGHLLTAAVRDSSHPLPDIAAAPSDAGRENGTRRTRTATTLAMTR